MTDSLALQLAPRVGATRAAAAGRVVPLLRASLYPASCRDSDLKDYAAGRILAEVLYRDADAGTFDGIAHLTAGVVLVLSWLVPALASQTDAGDPRELARQLAAQCGSGRNGAHVAKVLDHLLDGTFGAQVLEKLLADDQEALFEVVLRLGEVTAWQAWALAAAGDMDLEAIWVQIEQGLRDHP
ncbi:hypothetical protein [Streptacidiphilus pinicola]|nr:hypothetical protein [Streptacidiphilus pinicola]